jgi:hypothetical protein
MPNLKRFLCSIYVLFFLMGLFSCRTFSFWEKSTQLSNSPTIGKQKSLTQEKLSIIHTTSVPLDTNIPSFSSFNPVTFLKLAANENILNMMAESKETIWLITNQRVVRYQQNTWRDFLPHYEGKIIGIDPSPKIWISSNDGYQASAWDGAMWTSFGPESGWKPLADNSNPPPGRWSLTTDSNNQIWLSTNQDVRMFNGNRWTVYTLNDLGMPGPEIEDALFETKIAFLKTTNSIWVLNCYWVGPGPNGGGGARYFDGNNWIGSDSPVAQGCATTINEDRKGNIWLGLDNKLWKFNQPTGVWESYPAPKPPEAIRLGYFTDMRLDPNGEPWPEMALCGGASCFVGSIRYHVTEDGKWQKIGNVFTDSSLLFFDSVDQGWIFRSGSIFHVLENELEPIIDLPDLRVVSAPTGEIWVEGLYKGRNVLWTQSVAK